MKNVQGSPSIQIRQLGTPTWFFTLSAADMKWPDVIQTIAAEDYITKAIYPVLNKNRRAKKEIKVTQIIELFRLPELGEMIQCTQCNEWYHLDMSQCTKGVSPA